MPQETREMAVVKTLLCILTPISFKTPISPHRCGMMKLPTLATTSTMEASAVELVTSLKSSGKDQKNLDVEFLVSMSSADIAMLLAIWEEHSDRTSSLKVLELSVMLKVLLMTVQETISQLSHLHKNHQTIFQVSHLLKTHQTVSQISHLHQDTLKIEHQVVNLNRAHHLVAQINSLCVVRSQKHITVIPHNSMVKLLRNNAANLAQLKITVEVNPPQEVNLNRTHHLVALIKSLSVVDLLKGHAVIAKRSMVNPSRKFAANLVLVNLMVEADQLLHLVMASMIDLIQVLDQTQMGQQTPN
jgi:hypothetical protein